MNCASPVIAADIAVITSSLMKYAVNVDTRISGAALYESVNELMDLADRLQDTSPIDRERLVLARSLLERSLTEAALEMLDSIFRNYVNWPPQTRRPQMHLSLVPR